MGSTLDLAVSQSWSLIVRRLHKVHHIVNIQSVGNSLCKRIQRQIYVIGISGESVPTYSYMYPPKYFPGPELLKYSWKCTQYYSLCFASNVAVMVQLESSLWKLDCNNFWAALGVTILEKISQKNLLFYEWWVPFYLGLLCQKNIFGKSLPSNLTNHA